LKNAAKILLCLLLACCQQKPQALWQWHLQSRSYAVPIIDGDEVYVVSAAGEVISGEYKTGKRNWTKKLEASIVAAPAVGPASLFVATRDGALFSLQKSTGRQQWNRSFPGDGFEAPLTVIGDQVIAPSVGGTLYAIDQDNGALRWSLPGNRKYNIGAVSDGSLLFIGGWDKTFFALRPDGSIAWQWKAPEAIVDGPLLYQNLVCFATLNRFFIALEKASGRFAWRFETLNPAHPATLNKQIAIASNSNVMMLDGSTGRMIRSFSEKSQITDIQTGRNLYFFASNGLHQLDPSSGKVTVRHTSGEAFYRFAIVPPLAVVTDQLYSVFGISVEQ